MLQIMLWFIGEIYPYYTELLTRAEPRLGGSPRAVEFADHAFTRRYQARLEQHREAARLAKAAKEQRQRDNAANDEPIGDIFL